MKILYQYGFPIYNQFVGEICILYWHLMSNAIQINCLESIIDRLNFITLTELAMMFLNYEQHEWLRFIECGKSRNIL